MALNIISTTTSLLYRADGSFNASGGTETSYTSGGVLYKVHTFLSSGTFTVSIGSSTNIEVLIVAGGGGGGADNAGGGGAGGDAGNGTAGTANSGGGGGGGSGEPGSHAGGAGGSGIVVIRYKFQ